MFIWELLPLVTAVRVKHAVNTLRDADTNVLVAVEAPVGAPYGCRAAHQLVITPKPRTREQLLNADMVSVPNLRYLHRSTPIKIK